MTEEALWRKRAEYVGFQNWHGKQVSEMTEGEIAQAFADLGRDYGIFYIWPSRQGVLA